MCSVVFLKGLALKGWLEMLCGRELNMKKAVRYFDEALGYAISDRIFLLSVDISLL